MEHKTSYKFSIIMLSIILIATIAVAVLADPQNISTPDEPVSSGSDINVEVDKKPIIYLYPTEDMDVTVKLGFPENITCSYPKYNNGWKVSAKPNGDLIDIETNRSLYALYYEANVEPAFLLARNGFVVAKEDTVKFLEEKLSILGLNEQEAQEFIIYWLPILEQNNYNYIHFASENEINDNMPLIITPTPDTVIRVRMYFYGLEEKMTVLPQQLTPVVREGFTVVEWGGVELENIMPFRVKMPCGGIRRPVVKIPRLGGND